MAQDWLNFITTINLYASVILYDFRMVLVGHTHEMNKLILPTTKIYHLSVNHTKNGQKASIFVFVKLLLLLIKLSIVFRSSHYYSRCRVFLLSFLFYLFFVYFTFVLLFNSVQRVHICVKRTPNQIGHLFHFRASFRSEMYADISWFVEHTFISFDTRPKRVSVCVHACSPMLCMYVL